MAPSKGAKRKSDSPHTEGVETKRYSTRSSSKKRVSYNESDDGEENEAPSKIISSSDDDDFVIEDKEAIKYEKKKKQSPPSTNASQTKKKNVKYLALGHSDTPKQANSRLVVNGPFNIGFKPVSIDITKMKSELDLSDSSDSDSSLNNDCCSKTPASKLTSETDHEFESVSYKKQEQGLCSTIKNELVEESDKINPWIQNLEALKSDASELQETKPKQIEKKQPTRGKKVRPPSKKSPKVPKKKGQTDESSVAEMLKLEKAQDSSSSDSDDENWEKVKAPCVASEREQELPKSVEITLELSGLKQKKKGLDVENMIRLKINRIRREIQLDLHRTSLVGLLAHGYLVNKMLSDPEIMAAALSVVPSTGFPPTRTDLSYLEKFLKWISNHFKVNTSKTKYGSPGKQDILNCVASGKAQSISELVCTCVSICRSLGILSRLVLSLQPLPAKVDSSELQQKSQSTKKKVEKTSSDQSQNVTPERSGTHRSASQNTKKTDVGAEPTPIGTKSNSKKNPTRATTDRCKSKQPVKPRVANVREANMPKPSTSKIKDSKSPIKSTDQTKEEPKRSRRKSAEKPVKYEESPLDDTEEEISRRKSSPIKKQMAVKEKPTRNLKTIEAKKPKEKITPKRRRKSSSDEFEEPMSDDSEKPAPRKTAIKKEGHARSQKIISTDSEGEALAKRKKTIDIWMEVYLEQEEQWMSVDVISGQIHCDRNLERNASDPLLYVVAYNFDLTWKDVTARYASSFLSTTRKQRAHPTWKRILSIHREKPSPRSKAEDESLEKSLVDRPMPTSISEFKSHPLYALQRHLLKFEAIYPPSAIPVGYIRKEAVYARECVKNLHSRETWLKEAKVVRIGEKPYKIVKARPKWDRHSQKMVTDQPLELFGDWQIEDYIPPPAVDGVVPRNAYGNVELFLPTMLPKGTKHLQIPGLNKVARRLGIDCAPAMTGWDYHGGWSHPVYDGYVVCEEHVETLIDAWRVANEEQEKREREKKEKRVYDNWRRLIRGLLIRDRLQTKYFKNVIEEDISPVVDATANEVVQVALPNQKSTKTPLSNKRQKKK
ncbi:DNA repair protein complementing XP-C cells homolog [Daphnia carinata]|uniref:DNA repair protein complementing XP-C cells homolog n=1 Tax=Daphnia carinata TaxID=120202 RepID=UPI00257D0B24|nr:DNA repair protein complementing XP-C cells homolog [Daphnia carinata]